MNTRKNVYPTGMYTKEKISNIPVCKVTRPYASRRMCSFDNIINNINLFMAKGLKRFFLFIFNFSQHEVIKINNFPCFPTTPRFQYKLSESFF